jgi:hypothetical protein
MTMEHELTIRIVALAGAWIAGGALFTYYFGKACGVMLNEGDEREKERQAK